ncbi:MAG: D-proline reductase (dithiol) PrdB [Gammaproteobacteria bacterium]
MCHQTVSLVARTLEENGIATVVIGSAKDIVEHCGVARFLFTDFPLGNPCGRPDDLKSQQLVMTAALTMLDETTVPGTTVQTPLAWDDHGKWKTDFMHVGDGNRADLLAAGDRRRAEQAAART